MGVRGSRAVTLLHLRRRGYKGIGRGMLPDPTHQGKHASVDKRLSASSYICETCAGVARPRRSRYPRIPAGVTGGGPSMTQEAVHLRLGVRWG